METTSGHQIFLEVFKESLFCVELFLYGFLDIKDSMYCSHFAFQIVKMEI